MQASNRGKAFGALYLTGSLGGMFGSLYATNLGKTLVSDNMLNATTLTCHCICQLSVLGQKAAELLQSDNAVRSAKNCTRTVVWHVVQQLLAFKPQQVCKYY